MCTSSTATAADSRSSTAAGSASAPRGAEQNDEQRPHPLAAGHERVERGVHHLRGAPATPSGADAPRTAPGGGPAAARRPGPGWSVIDRPGRGGGRRSPRERSPAHVGQARRRHPRGQLPRLGKAPHRGRQVRVGGPVATEETAQAGHHPVEPEAVEAAQARGSGDLEDHHPSARAVPRGPSRPGPVEVGHVPDAERHGGGVEGVAGERQRQGVGHLHVDRAPAPGRLLAGEGHHPLEKSTAATRAIRGTSSCPLLGSVGVCFIVTVPRHERLHRSWQNRLEGRDCWRTRTSRLQIYRRSAAMA